MEVRFEPEGAVGSLHWRDDTGVGVGKARTRILDSILSKTSEKAASGDSNRLLREPRAALC